MNDRSLILAIDQGTTNTKVLLVDASGVVVYRVSQPVGPTFPQPGWVEQDPMALWQSVMDAVDDCLDSAGHPGLVGIAITNQRESVLVWERATGQPVGPMIIWQCRRTAPFCEQLRMAGHEANIHQRTGLTIDPLFSASKIRWLLDHTRDGHERAAHGELCAGTVDSWLLWNLTGGAQHRCDQTNAARTQLLNLHTVQWDQALLEIFGIPEGILPEVLPSSACYGETVPIGSLPGGLPIMGMIGDSHAALFGQAGFKPGSVKATYGTGSSLMHPMSTVFFSERGISTTIAWGTAKSVTYALEGNITVTGAAVQWLGDLLGFSDPADASRLAGQVGDTEGLYIVPAFAGLGAPHWKEDARGLVTGLTRGTTAAHLARAVAESIAYQVRDVFDVMKDESNENLDVLLADGGGSRNDLLMQFQADILNCPVERNNAADLSALGAAYLAGLASGTWSSLYDIAGLPRSHDRFEPQMSQDQRETLYTGWQQAIARTVFNPSGPN